MLKISLVLLIPIIFILFISGCTAPSQETQDITSGETVQTEDDSIENGVEEEMEFAPVPDNAKGVSIDQEKGYFVEEISDGLYWVTEGSYQVMFLTTGEAVIVVDAPPTIGDKYLAAIKEVTDEPITHVIYSHSHADHIAVASMFPSDAIYIAQEETAKVIEAINSENRSYEFGMFLGGSKVPEPSITFTDKYTLEVGSQVLELEYRGPVHNSGSIFIYAPNQKVLMLVDVIFPGWSPFLDLAVSSCAM